MAATQFGSRAAIDTPSQFGNIKMFTKYREYLKAIRRDIAGIQRGVAQISLEVGANLGEIRVDETTPRIDCLQITDTPVLLPGAYPWMEKAVYDARPVTFKGRQLAFFCGQPSYNTNADLMVGVAEWDGKEYIPADRPCIYPTDEKNGIDIPSFCTDSDRIIAVYFDNYGLRRVNDCRTQNLIVCMSEDGRHFTKTYFERPLADYPYPKMGLPWVEYIDGDLFLTVRSRPPGRNVVSRASFDPETGHCTDWQHANLPRTSINVASVTNDGMYHVFHSYTVGAGLYVSTFEAETMEPISDVMLVDSSVNPWGWDMRKVCASPERVGEELVVLYTATNGIGRAVLALDELRGANA
jgi:hypothetical protein